MKSIGLLSMFILVLLIGISSLSVAQERKLVVAIPIQAIATYVGQPQPTNYWRNNTITHPSQWETYLANTDYFVWFYNKNGMLSTTLGQEFTPSLYGTIHNDLEANGLRQLTHDLCIANGTKMVLDIEDLFTTENFFEIIVADAVRSQNFANQVYDYIVANGYLGGVMIDWEWPAGTVSASDFNRFAGMLRAKIDLIPGAILGIWVAPWYPYAGYSNMVSGIDTYFDFAAPMDYSYGNNIHKLGHFMQLAPAAENVAKGSGWDPSMSDANYGLQSWTKTGGIRASKLAMVFTGEARTINTGTGLTPPLSIGYDLPGNIGIYQWGDAGTLRKEAYRKCIDAKVQFGEQWDAAMSSPYVINSDGTKMWQYDNPRSIRAKMDWAISEWDPKYMVVWEMGGWLLPNPPAGHSFGEAWTALSEYRGIIIPPVDTDGDGVIDEFDLCPNTPIGTQVDATGCPIIIIPPTDTDGDGVLDSNDLCPNTPAGTVVDATGCAIVIPSDSDGDGVIDANDLCPNTPAGTTVDVNGCEVIIVPPTEDSIILYKDDVINSAWINASWSNTLTFNSTEQSVSGTSMKGIVGAWGAFRFLSGNWATYNNLDPTGYSKVTFSIYALQNSVVKVYLGRQGGTGTFPSINASLTAGVWKDVSINMIDLAPNGDLFNYILLNNSTSSTVTWYVDNLYVEGNGIIVPPTDTDGDGVTDDIDQCPNTPPGTIVDVLGCAIVIPPSDSDGDGVTDNIDQCPGTPSGTTVDSVGCAVVIPPVDTTPPDVNITFPINGDTIKGESAINVIATDSFGVKSVEFKINGISIGIDTVIPYTVMWNTNLMSDGIYSIEAIATDISDLISATSISVEVDNITAPPPPPGGEFTIGVLSGWNMISVPTYNKFNNYSRYVLFPTAIGYAYEFNDGYTAVEVLEIGKGYWLKFPITTDVIVGVNEDAVLSDTIDIIVGWNLIGTIGYEVPILNIVSEPGGIIVSEFFEFNGGYVSKNILIPGKAYWVNSSQAGKLILNKIITPPSTNKIMIAPTESQPPQSPKGNGKGKGIKKTNTFSFEPEIKDLSVETYPNPANPYFTTTVNVPHKGVLSFEVYDVLGREVYKSIEYDVEYGVYNYEFGRSLALSSGTYFMVTKLVNGYIILIDKLLLMK